MNREQIIEAMAHNDGLGPCQAGAILDTLKTAIPGLADVIAGKAVVVPVEPTSAMKEHTALQVMMTDWADLDPEEQAGLYHIYSAMIEARPK